MAAMLGVLLVHALFAWAVIVSSKPDPYEPPLAHEAFTPMEWFEIRDEAEDEPTAEAEPAEPTSEVPVRVARPDAPRDAESGAPPVADTAPSWVDWPRETRLSAARVLEREREAERIAKMFAGPDGTWASLTKRQQSEFNHFRWREGVDGLERDENGNTIYRINDRCVLVNFIFFGCSIGGKPPAYGDLFKDMRRYFDEQRLPRTDEGNGTEPESRRPPKWSKPLPERRLPPED